MSWIAGAHGKRVIKGDWVAADRLRHIDPYLVWFDITDFGGVSLLAGDRMPMMVERRRPSHPRYGSSLCKVSDLRKFLDHEFRPDGPVVRFEVAPGIVNDGLAPDLAAPAGDTSPDAADRRGQRQVVGFIDYGCAFAHRHFRRSATGPGTRVLAIWDQAGALAPPQPRAGLSGLQWRVPPEFGYGTETHREQRWYAAGSDLPLDEFVAQFMRNGALDEEACYRHSGYAPVVDRQATHGTHIMDVATGWPDPLRQILRIAPGQDKRHEDDIVFVQLPRQVHGRPVGGLLRTHVYDGLCYIESCAPKDARVVVNLSYGGYAGPHDGTSILECAIDDFLRLHRRDHRRFDLVMPAGNARHRRLHVRHELAGGEVATFKWNNLPDDPSDSFVEIWLPRQTGFAIRIAPPGAAASASAWLAPGSAASLVRPGGTMADVPLAGLVFAAQACQSNAGTMALFATGPTRLGARRPAAPYGCWTIEVRNEAALEGQAAVHAWCELDSPPFGTEDLPRQAYFSEGFHVDRESTLNGIAHGVEPIVVGAHALGGDVAGYSGTGPGRGAAPGSRARQVASKAMPKPPRGPEALAPCDESAATPGLLAAAVVGTDTVRLNGTSVAAAAMTRRILDGHIPRPQSQNGKSGSGKDWPRPEEPARRPVAGRDPHPDSDLLPRRR